MRVPTLAFGVLAFVIAGCGPTAVPDLSISLNAPPTSINVGNSVAVNVTVTRAGGLNDPISVSLQNPPAGITATALTIPAGGSSGAATLSVAANAPQGTKSLTFVGSAGGLTKTVALDVLVRDVPGSLDKTFATDGKAFQQGLSPDFSDVRDSLALPDGKIIVLARAQPSAGSTYGLLLRFQSAGVLDTSFGTGGVAKVNFDATHGIYVSALALQSDGKIIVAGMKNTAKDDKAFVARFDVNGAVDASFNTTGAQEFVVGTSSPYIGDVTVQSDDKILVVGGGKPTASAIDQFVTFRVGKNGDLDTSFDTDGIVFTAPGTLGESSYANTVLAVTSGGVLVGGRSTISKISQFQVIKYTSSGVLDTGFSADGEADVAVGAQQNNGVTTMKVLPDGKILLAGTVLVASTNKFGATRLTANGALDTTFGTDGKFTGGISGDVLQSVAVQSDGKIILAGSSPGYTGNYDFYLLRLEANGTADASFGASGKVFTDIGSDSYDSLNGVSVQSDGRIVALGSTSVNTPSPARGVSIARYWN